jgi:uncharacterized short protein YbdD (DUF466 family)
VIHGGASQPARLLLGVWNYLRDVTGESGYDRYLQHHRDAGHLGKPLTQREWLSRCWEERYNSGGVYRCC